MNLIQDLLNEMLEHSLNPGTIIADGRIHRFNSNPQDKKRSGWYVCHSNHTRKSGENFLVCVYGNYADPDSPWKHQSGNVTYTSEDGRAVKEQMEKAQREQETERAKAHEEVSAEVSKVWASLTENGESQYLIRKKINNLKLGIRFYEDGTIAVPLRDVNGKIWTLQRISWDGQKRLYSGGRKRGCFHIIGDLEGSRQIFIAEGLATGVSIYQATGQAVAVAIDSGNLLDVTESIKRAFYSKPIFICADDDKYGAQNVGRKKAEEAAEKFLVRTIFPSFNNEETKPSDFNDLHCLEGIEEVRRQIDEAIEFNSLVPIDKMALIRVPYPDDDEFSKAARRGTMGNTIELLRRLEIIVRYNVITKEEEILIPGLSFSIDNRSNATLAHIISWHEVAKVPHGNLKNYLTAIADQNQYNPVVTWIESKPWDKIERFDNFCQTIKAKGESDIEVKTMKNIMIRKWMISAVAGAFEPNGIVARGMLVLQGPQYLGKSKWFKTLCPQDLGIRADGVILKPEDKDSVFQAVSKWLVELGELDGTLSKSDDAQLKAFISRQHDELRRPFKPTESKFARRTVFFASVNQATFLKDPTGNSRFWTIPCESIDHDHAFDMQQVWAEVKTFYQNGETWFLDAAEMGQLNASNEYFEQVDPIEELIRTKYNWSPESTQLDKKTATEICISIGVVQPKKSDVISAGRALRKLSRSITKPKGVVHYSIPFKSN